MATIKRFIYVDAPPAVIDAVGLNTDRLTQWFAGIEEAVPDDDYPMPGSTMQVTMRASGMTMHLTQTVLERIPGEKTVMAVENDMVNAEITWFYEEVEDGRTKVSLHYTYTMPKINGIGRMIENVVERIMVSNLEKSLRNLKLMIEGEALRQSA